MVVFSFLVALPLLGVVSAKPAMYVHDSRIAPAAGFAPVASATDSHVLDMRVRLSHGSPKALEQALLAVSTPGNARYGQHLSKDEVAALTRPDPETTRAVKAFFAAHSLNATEASPAGDWLRVRVPATKANELFDADYRVFAHGSTGKQLVRTLQYSLPQELKGHINMVYPSTSFFTARSLPVTTVKKTSKRSPKFELPEIGAASDLADVLRIVNESFGGALPALPDAASQRKFGQIASFAHGSKHDSSQDFGFPIPSGSFDLCSFDLSDLPSWLQQLLKFIIQKKGLCDAEGGSGGGELPTDSPAPPTDTEFPFPTDFPSSSEPLPFPTDFPTDTAPEPIPTETGFPTDPLPFPTDIPSDTELPIPAPTDSEPVPIPSDTELPIPIPTDTELPIPSDTELPFPTESEPLPTGLPTELPIPTDTEPFPTALPTDTEFPVPSSTDSEPIPTEVPTDTESAPAPTDIPTDSAPVPTSTEAPAPPSGPAPTPGTPDASCEQAVTPQCLQQLYGIPTTPAKQASNKLGVTGYLGQFAQTADLESFLQQFREDIDASTSFDTQTLDGGKNPQDASQAGIEANLDIQYTIGVATGVPVTFITVGDDSSNDPFLDTITNLISADAPPQVLTTSYGEGEADAGADLADALCNAYMQLGARGVSIIFASGDSGVAAPSGQCSDKFAPTFPASCPYITAVGSTQGFAPETAAAFSSGGFSEHFDMPDYQSSAVASYLQQLGDTNSGKFNPKGRAYPDVSTQGVNFAVVNGGQVTGVQGTSASSPLFASVIALINDELAGAGKPPLGFLNPWLYSTAANAFMDVTSGNNPGCGTDGFEAMSGWDPVTGLGTPNYEALRAAAGLA
ncbi:subtilisin-like protein [Exidia glandulosa HHB12029]|uniref:tripeptidyl-peptidase II n=1 Tax=Exidia glandulosa HHB12029 TaxID=1314781 RepID=A0A165D6J0_EXIGL|nr:subtilisin-like protein [Exidia glandulosa HHB12029]